MLAYLAKSFLGAVVVLLVMSFIVFSLQSIIPADPARWEALGLRGASRVAALVEAHRDVAIRTRSLATLVRDVPGVRAGLRGLRWQLRDHTRVEALFEELGWERIATRIPRAR